MNHLIKLCFFLTLFAYRNSGRAVNAKHPNSLRVKQHPHPRMCKMTAKSGHASVATKSLRTKLAAEIVAIGEEEGGRVVGRWVPEKITTVMTVLIGLRTGRAVEVPYPQNKLGVGNAMVGEVGSACTVMHQKLALHQIFHLGFAPSAKCPTPEIRKDVEVVYHGRVVVHQQRRNRPGVVGKMRAIAVVLMR